MKAHTQAPAQQASLSTHGLLAAYDDTRIDDRITRILQDKKISTPTPIQSQAIPAVLAGDDVMGIAQTGTGKTLAFVVPMIQKLLREQGSALVVVPTRELAYQVEEVCRWFSALHMFSTVIVGGAPMDRQLRDLKRRPRIIVATPGRLNDHLERSSTLLQHVSYLVLDEADRMFDMGFAPQIKNILKHVPQKDNRQTVLFSATMPDEIARLAREIMHTPLHIEIAPTPETKVDITQEIVIIEKAHHTQALFAALQEVEGTVLVFTRTKHQARKLTYALRDNGIRAEELHSGRSLPQRKKALQAVKEKRSRVLVATDVAARGIDIDHMELVINYDLPESPEEYVHRIGRTGRAGRKGRALSFVIADQADLLRRIERTIQKSLEPRTLEGVPAAALKKGGFSGGSRGGGRGGRQQRGRKPFGRNRQFGDRRQSEQSSSSSERFGNGSRPYHQPDALKRRPGGRRSSGRR